jgi:geranylgeranyl diphosphate synthase type II
MAGASADDLDNLYKTGEQIGLAFQLQDDLLDVYGDPQVFGKNIGGDIVSNKKTYMLINALNRANPAQHAKLVDLLQTWPFDRSEKIEAVTELYNAIGIRELCEERINYYFEQGCQYLDRVNVPEARKTILRQYIAQMVNRQS